MGSSGVIGHTLWLFFDWPLGSVWSNLIASVICAVFVWWRLRARMIAQHAEALAQAARHHKERLSKADEHHEALKAKVDALTAQARTAKTLVTKTGKGASA